MANTNTTDVNSDWNPTTDIYDITKSITSVKKRYIDDQDETTLSLGIYGFLSDILSKEIQTDVIMTGLLGNEMFPSRAQLSKNVLAHAVYNSILDNFHESNEKMKDEFINISSSIGEIIKNFIKRNN